jgi:hypothetical protein
MPVDNRTNQLTQVTGPIGEAISLLRPTELRGKYRIAAGQKTLPSVAVNGEFHIARLPIDSFLSRSSWLQFSATQTGATFTIYARLAPSVQGEAFTAAEITASEGGPNVEIGEITAPAANALVNVVNFPVKTLREIITAEWGALETADRRFNRSDVDLVVVVTGAASAAADFTQEIGYVVE